MFIIASDYLSDSEISKYAKGRRSYLQFHSNDKTDTMSASLQTHGFEHIDLKELIVSNRSGLREAVIKFSGALNSNPPHPDWWAIRTSRRVAMYDFSNALAKLYILRLIIDRGIWDTVIVFDNSVFPWNYLKNSKHQGEIRFHTKFSFLTDWKARFNAVLPITTLLWLLRKIEIKTKLGWPPVLLNKKYHKPPVSMLTLIHKNSFTKEKTFKDLYLGDLANNFRSNGHSTFVMGQFHDKPSMSLISAINSQDNNSFVLMEHLWSLKDLLMAFKDSLKGFFSSSPEWSSSIFAGFDIQDFLNLNLKLELQREYADNLLYYKAAKIFIENISPELLIYPYENKCIERMILKAVSDVSPETRTVGYQHAVLTPKHIHMFLAEGEAKELPLPDRIITNGPHTARILREGGNYPDGMIVAGTALRQTSTVPDNLIKKHPPENIKNVLVTLAEGQEEYDKAFNFLSDLQKTIKMDDINFRVRLHPGIPYDPFKNEKLMRGIKCEKDTIRSLPDSVYWADIVMYASTSVAAQAMVMGIPVIWMDLLDFWGTDPITSGEVLKWELHSPDDWSQVISEIEQMSEQSFGQKTDNSKKFVSECFCQDPVDLNKWLVS